MKKNFLIPVVMYPFDVMVSINQTYDEFAANVMKTWDATLLEGFKKDTLQGAGRAEIFYAGKHRCVIIKLEDFKKDSFGYATLAHEIFHAAEFILRICGFNLNENSHEAYAYLISYLTKRIYEKL